MTAKNEFRLLICFKKALGLPFTCNEIALAQALPGFSVSARSL